MGNSVYSKCINVTCQNVCDISLLLYQIIDNILICKLRYVRLNIIWLGGKWNGEVYQVCHLHLKPMMQNPFLS